MPSGATERRRHAEPDTGVRIFERRLESRHGTLRKPLNLSETGRAQTVQLHILVLQTVQQDRHHTLRRVIELPEGLGRQNADLGVRVLQGSGQRGDRSRSRRAHAAQNLDNPLVQLGVPLFLCQELAQGRYGFRADLVKSYRGQVPDGLEARHQGFDQLRDGWLGERAELGKGLEDPRSIG